MPTENRSKGLDHLHPQVKPVVADIHAFHRIKDELDDAIRAICMYQNVIDAEMVEKLKGVIGRSTGNVNFDVSEVDRQYHMFLAMQRKVSDPSGNLLATAELKEIGTIISSMNSLLSLFMKSQKDIDSAREEAKLKDAVLSAIRDLDTASQARFFAVMDGE